MRNGVEDYLWAMRPRAVVFKLVFSFAINVFDFARFRTNGIDSLRIFKATLVGAVAKNKVACKYTADGGCVDVALYLLNCIHQNNLF